jgi:hypothetical protein
VEGHVSETRHGDRAEGWAIAVVLVIAALVAYTLLYPQQASGILGAPATSSGGGGLTLNSYSWTPSSLVVGTGTTGVVNVTGGIPPYTYTWGGLPASCGSENTSVLPCVPEVAGTYTVIVVAEDTSGLTADASASFTVSTQSGGPPPNGEPPVAFLTYNDGLTTDLVDNSALLRSGDIFYLSSGNFGATPSAANINKWASQLHAVDPGGIFVAHTGGLANVNTILSQGLSNLITWFSIDEEPSEPGFSQSQSATASQLSSFTSTVHAAGLKSIGYMTGQGVYNYGWDYSAFAAVVDHVTVETQGDECVAGEVGPQCVDLLAGQFSAAHAAASGLSVQATVGSTSSGTTVTTAEVMATYNESIAKGLGYFFLEFAGGTVNALVAVLQAMGR